MTLTPRLIPSRSQTRSPSPQLESRPSLEPRLSLPSLQGKATTSRAVSQTTLTALPPRLFVSAATPTTDASPASSVINLELSEGIILRDTDEVEGDVAENEEIVEGIFTANREEGEERKKNLRDHLRRTLSRKDTGGNLLPGRLKSESHNVDEISHSSAGETYPQRQYFVITDAGKPVFVSRPENATEDLTTITGITSALISVFADSTLFPSSTSSGADKLRCINVGSTRITFLLRPPLYYVCVSKWREPESVTRMHLDYLHLQILSVITGSQLRRIFERRTNFDLRRLLEGAETFLHTLLARLQTSLAFCATLSALASLRLDTSLRNRLGDALVPSAKTTALDILYVLLISGDRVITLVRPRKHSVHPTDLHILLNVIHTPSIHATPASWLPVCLPKFNPQGFVHAYVSFLDQQDQPTTVTASSGSTNGGEGSPGVMSGLEAPASNHTLADPSPKVTPVDLADNSSGEIREPSPTPNSGSTGVSNALSHSGINEHENSSRGTGEKQPESHESLRTSTELSLVVVSGGGEFDATKRWSESVTKKLETTGLMSLLRTAIKAAPYTCSELGIPGLRHFLYKSRVHVQVTSPTWDEEYQTLDNQRRLITLYQTLHDAIHAKSGQEKELKLQYIRTDKEAVMGWIAQPFELYIAVSPRLPKAATVGAANAVARWVKREEPRLFLRDAPVF